MRVLLVHGKYFNSWEALGLGYIGAYLHRHAPGIELDFIQGCFDSDVALLDKAERADHVMFSCTTPTVAYARAAASGLWRVNPRAKLTIGGYHPSALPKDCLDLFDYAVVGEGEEAARRIVAGEAAPGVVHGTPVPFTPGLWPDRELIRNERNIEVAFGDTGKRITSVQSHRSCPFHCKYCLDGHHNALYDGIVSKLPMTFRPVDDLLDEIEVITERYRLDLLKFSDPTWNTKKKWVKEFCRRKIERGIKVPFYPNMHAEVADEEMFDLMAAAGCYEIAVGVESGSPKILAQIGKHTTVEGIRKTCGWAKARGILVRGYFILGMPDESDEDIRLTEQFAEELGLDEYGFTILCPYPGTQMYNADPDRFHDVDWAKTDEYSNDFWCTAHLSNAQLKEWQTRLVNRFRKKLTWHNRAVENSG
jgi:anaerobic magnesium-protoporphyrin IX monomethyl ester cyclase